MPPISRQISSIRQLVIEFAEWRGSGGVRFIYFYFLDVNRCMWLIFEQGMWTNGYIKKCYAFWPGDINVEAVLNFDSHVDPLSLVLRQGNIYIIVARNSLLYLDLYVFTIL